MKQAAMAVLATCLLAGCGFPVVTRGNDPPKSVLAEIKPGVTTKATVTKILGSPSSVATFNNNTWYYISQQTQNVAFFKPQLRGEKVVIISFNNQGVVDNVAYRGLRNHEDITPNPNATPAPGREFTILEQLIGNFGRFSAPAPQPGSGPSPTSGP
jgi:outer membrane protein assembly factor BamE (lipoprotein component of BamABCDE complex)